MLSVPRAPACAPARWASARAARLGACPWRTAAADRRAARSLRLRTGGNDVPVRDMSRIAIATTLVVILAVAITVVATPWWERVSRNTFVAYFANTNGLYTGDEVRILGVAVGTVEEIDPQPSAAKVTFSVGREYPVPADARRRSCRRHSSAHARSSWCLHTPPARNWLTARTIPKDAPRFRSSGTTCASSWRSSPTRCSPPPPAGQARLASSSTAPRKTCAVRVTPRGTRSSNSPQAVSALGDHSTDMFSTVRNLQLLVSALSSSSDLLAAFNTNLADITTVLSNTPNEVANATQGLDGAVNDLRGFVAENREGLGVTSITSTRSPRLSTTAAVTSSRSSISHRRCSRTS